MAAPSTVFIQILQSVDFISSLPLSSLVQLCSAYPVELAANCTDELQRRATALQQRLAPESPPYPFDRTNPVDSMIRLATYLLPRQPWTYPVEIGDELFYPLNQLMFRAGLLGGEPELTQHLLTKGGDIEPLLYGLLLGNHLDTAARVAASCLTNPNCQLFTNFLNDVGPRLTYRPGPYLNRDLLRLLGTKDYRPIIRYWFERTINPQMGLTLIAQEAARQGNSALLTHLDGSPYWYRPTTLEAIRFATWTGNTMLLDMLVPRGGIDASSVLSGLGWLEEPNAHNRAILNQYYLQRGLEWNTVSNPPVWIDPSLGPLTENERAANTATAQGQQPLSTLQQQPRYVIDLLRQASQSENWPLVDQILETPRSAYILASSVARRSNGSGRVTPDQNKLLQHYNQLGLITPEVAHAIVFLAPSIADAVYWLRQPIIADNIDVNIIMSGYMSGYMSVDVSRTGVVRELMQLYPNQIDPALIVRLMTNRYWLMQLLQWGVDNPELLGQVIYLITSVKAPSMERGYWSETANVLKRTNNPLLKPFLTIVAQHTNQLYNFTLWLGRSDIRDPTFLNQLRTILCGRFPNDCPAIEQGIDQLLSAPLDTIVHFPGIAEPQDIPRRLINLDILY